MEEKGKKRKLLSQVYSMNTQLQNVPGAVEKSQAKVKHPSNVIKPMMRQNLGK